MALTEFPFSLWLYQKYFDIERIGWGLYPTHNWTGATPGHNAEHSAASASFVASRMDAFEAYKSSYIAIWAITPGETGERAMEERWKP